jgi:hypothetical protein
MRIHGKISTIGWLLVTVLFVTALSAQAAVNEGVDWLLSNQDTSGLWGVDKQTPFRDACVVVDVLSILRADTVAVESAISAIEAMGTNSSDYLSRKMSALVAAIDEPAAAGLVDSLASMQNDDGGWGYRKDYRSNVLETALALTALESSAYSNMTKLGLGVGYLSSTQNADGGWTFVAGDSSVIFYTAKVVNALVMLRDGFNVSSEIQDAVVWLKTQAQGDGGFGTGGVSNPYETGLAISAIFKEDPAAPEITNAVTYLENTQLPDGSWGSDAYSTALAVYGLIHVGPDLAIESSDIVLSNPAPSDSELVTVSATVHNVGIQGANDVLVRIFDGDPDTGGLQLGSDITIANLAAGADSTVQVDWDTYELAGDHDIYVSVDPLYSIREPDESNNIGVKPVHVYFPADITIEDGGVEFDPEEPVPGEDVIIRITVKNIGETAATGISLQIWEGPPSSENIPLLHPPYVIPVLNPGTQTTIGFNMEDYFGEEGDYLIVACVDWYNEIREADESNNCNQDTLEVRLPTHPMTLYSGLDLLGLPLDPIDPQTSYSMIPQIPHCIEIDGWDRPAQRWISAVEDTASGMIIGDDFPIELRDGFFARIIEPDSMFFSGARVEEHGCTDLEQGLDLVSVPNEDACYTAYKLINDIDTCDEAHEWDPILQTWNSTIKVGEDEFIGEDFPIARGYGYFVKVDAGGQWCTSLCDTITLLPDLLVTSDDILLDPNPVDAGAEVGIFVNIHNIGDETAYSPRLDIYVGDPDAGGTLIIGGNLPVNIPPGGSSGYYGNYVIFEVPGFYDIYGVADYYDVIDEYDETNNKAFRTLQVLALLTTSQESSEGELSTSIAPHRGGRVSLMPHPYLASAPASESRGASPSGESPSTDGKAAETSGQGVTEITGVAVGNPSSSSVTITWLTDGPATGCVNHGPTPDLPWTECEIGPASEIHTVVLDGLTEDTSYYFEVVSGDVTDNNQGQFYSFVTSRVGAGLPSILYGRVVEAAAGSGVAGVIVSGTLERGEVHSHLIVVLTQTDGRWLLNLGNLKDATSNDVLAYETGDMMVLRFEGGSEGSAVDTVMMTGSSPQDAGVQEIGASSDLEPPTGARPSRYYLAANYPNPFKLGTVIGFGLPGSERVELTIYDVSGRRVTTLAKGHYEAGNYTISWDGRSAGGHQVSSGIYFYRLKAGEFVQIRRMFLLR